jgi:general secretion pathway protein I
MRSAFTLLEVLIAVAIVGMAFGAFLLLSGRIVETTDVLLKTTLSTLAANNALNEILYMRKSYNNREVDILNYRITVNQDFEDLMGFRVLKVEAGTPETGKLVELYEVR